ncbi:protein RNA-directed DNA methylation 3 isoform X2 [Ipomoea triloba]|uniref:protein RNA-directed DNA methylation 3 isoform X2 n=1 Tax=Ipomoea triloba TaxID=35885 RepID=UPI00125D58E1|nr:protein RNA-directed DNA methylation 3 isoform X2 [Ipomoea triloba]
MVSSKGKEKVGAGDKAGAGKRKIDLTGGKDDDKTGKRKRNDVLQFFEDSAFEVGDDEYSDDSDFFDTDFIDDEFGTDDGVQKQHEKAPVFPLVPKEEEMDEEELEKMLRERYKAGSSFVKFAEDGYEKKGSIQEDISVPSTKDPTIWKVKCMVGRERHSAFCLMQKYVDLRVLGMKLQIISAFALDHVKGFVYIEADKQSDVNEACKGLCSIYSSRMSPVPRNEISQLISVRSKCNGISEGMWARVKSGKYKGDLAQVVAVNDVQKKVTVKLIPRIDLQALAEKFGGGVVAKKASIPAPRLIRSTELEDFRPLITIRKDRETNQMVEVLDGKMLREGYLFKKVSIDSLCFWGVMPSETELLKFEPYKNDEPQDTEWLSQLYGERKRKRTIKHDKGNGKGGEKGEGSSNSANGNNFEVDDLVFFGRKDFGIIIGTEKENVYKIMKEGSEGPVLVTVQLRELRAACFDRKLFTVKDQHKNTISINDIVRVLDGPSKDRQGIVKQIYKGVIFLYDEMGEEHNRYVCVKAPVCERISRSHGLLSGKESEAGPSTGFAETPSSPNTPLSPKKPCRERGDNSNFSRGDKDGLLFSVGQSVRIRVGPLKGYICRVLAVRQSDVTVKLDSRQKILTVKSEHLSEVHGRSSTISLGSADPEAAKPFDLLGAQDGSTDWTSGGLPASAQDENWNAGLPSNERSAWPSFPASSCLTTQLDPNSISPLTAVDVNNDAGNSAWDSGTTQNKNASWGASGVSEKNVADAGQDSGWGGSDSWKKSVPTTGVGSSSSDGTNKDNASNWGASGTTPGKETSGNWNQPESSGWNKATVRNEGQSEGWGNKVNGGGSDGSSWGKSVGSQGKGAIVGNSDAWDSKGVASSSLSGPVSESKGWGNAGSSQDGGSTWSKQDAGSSWNKKEDKSSCAKQGGTQSSWGKQDSKIPDSSGGGDGGSSWGKQEGASWGKQDGGSWNKKEDTSWNKQGGGPSSGQQANKDGGSWNKQEGGSSWGKQDGGSWNKEDKSNKPGGSSWGKQDGGSWNKEDKSNKPGGSSWGKQDGGSWNKEDKSNKPGGETSWGQQADKDGGSWSKPEGGSSWKGAKTFGSGDGYGNRNGGEFGNKDGSDQQGSWGRENTFDGGRGFGGRRGRGGGRGRDNFGRGRGRGGRSFDRGESSSWGKEGEDNNGSGFAGGSSWKSSQESSWGKVTSSTGWKTDQSEKHEGSGFAGGQTSWKSSQESSWGKVTSNDENNKASSGWGSTQSEKTENNKAGSSSGWGSNQSEKTESNKAGSSSGWGSDKLEKTERDEGGWNAAKPSGETQSSSWNRKSSTNEEKTTSGGDGWSTGKGSGSENNQSSGWNKKSSDGGGIGDAVSGWGNNEQSWKTNNSAAGNQSSGWKSEGSQDPNAWSSKSNWNSGSGFAGDEQQPDSSNERGRGGWRGGRGGSDIGGFGGRGGSDRGGFRGRGRSDRGGFQGRGGSDRGGFRGRGGFDRGGFGGRGRGRRDQNDEWNNRNDFGDGKPSSWSSGSGSDPGSWKASDGSGSWSQGGSGKGQWQSWSAGGSTSKVDGHSSKAGGWNNKNDSGDGKPGSWKTGSGSDAGGWKASDDNKGSWGGTEKGQGGWKNGSGSDAGGWKSSDNKGSWNETGSGKGQGQSWSAAGSTSKTDGHVSEAGGWNKGSSANAAGGDASASKWSTPTQENTSGNLNSSWNSSQSNASEFEKSKEACGATESGGPADAWGKASSSWGKGSDGGGKGGW